ATAFKWDKSLVYDDEDHKAVMTGGVIVDHRDDVTKEDAMRLTGDVVTAELEPVLAPATQPTTTPSTKPASNEPRYQLRRAPSRAAPARLPFQETDERPPCASTTSPSPPATSPKASTGTSPASTPRSSTRTTLGPSCSSAGPSSPSSPPANTRRTSLSASPKM